MSTPTGTQAISETTPLLGNSQPAVQWSGNLSKEQFGLSPEALLIPVALATRLATMIPSTTIVELVHGTICRLWSTPSGGPSPELCDAPEVSRYFAIAIATLSAIEGILSIAGCGLLSRISSHYGRKPAFLLVLIVGTIGSCLIPGSQYMPDWLTDSVFLVGLLLGLFSGALPYTYLTNMYIVDVCVPENRTAALSKIAGWASLGLDLILRSHAFSQASLAGNPALVFYIAATIYTATFIYVSSFLPESFPVEKRDALSRVRSEPGVDGLPAITLFQIFEPLKMLIPTRKSDGTRNWRLTWCAIHILVFMVANAYALAAWLVLVTSKYHLTSADTGLFLTIVSVSGTVVLTVIVPPLVRFLLPYYRRRSVVVQEDIVTCEELESGLSDRLDIHLAFISCVIAGVFYLTAAVSTTSRALIFSAVCIGFASVHTPTIRSLVAGSVDPLKQGEALAAIEMVSNTGSFLSPIIMGSILSATIGTTPLLLFYVHLAVVLVSSAFLFLVRDADRSETTRRMSVRCGVGRAT